MGRCFQENPLLRGTFYGVLFSIPIWVAIIWAIWYFAFH